MRYGMGSDDVAAAFFLSLLYSFRFYVRLHFYHMQILYNLQIEFKSLEWMKVVYFFRGNITRTPRKYINWERAYETAFEVLGLYNQMETLFTYYVK